MNREEIIRSIPTPTNEEVIIYDIDLKDLIDINVFEKYYKDLSTYNLKKENYILLDKEIKEYEKNIDNIYLYDKSWTETDYLENLNLEKKNYAALYGDIKKIENDLSILQKKYNNINEKIEMQRIQDSKFIENKKKNIDSEIDSLKEQINKIKEKNEEKLSDLSFFSKDLDKKNAEKEIYEYMKLNLNTNSCSCKYCGTILNSAAAKRTVSNNIEANLKETYSQIKSLTKRISKLQNDINCNTADLTTLTTLLNANVEFKKEDYNFYMKKSIEILRLEATRDNIITKISEIKEQYEKNPKIKNENFIKCKDKIEKYELSLENIKKIKDTKESFTEKYNFRKTLIKECQELKNNLIKYKKFITIFYKIYEQKINLYFGKDFKFSLYEFQDFQLNEVFIVKYKDIEYSSLNKIQLKECDSIYYEKISSFSDDRIDSLL